jgi:hypothetical protein
MKLRLGILLSSLMFLLTACNEDSSFQPDFSRLTGFKVKMTDAPLDVEEVIIDLRHVIVFSEKGQRDTLETEAGLYDLLDLQNGEFADIAAGILDFNFVREVRLVLGDDNAVRVNGERFKMEVPSGSSSGLKLKTCIDLSETSEYVLNLDFEANKSVHSTGSGNFILKPVIKVLNEDAHCGGQDGDGDDPDHGDDYGDDDSDGIAFDDLPGQTQEYLDLEYPGYEFEISIDSICGEDEEFLKVTAKKESEEIDVYFDFDGNFVQEESMVNAAEMPGIFQNIIATNYPSYHLDGQVIFLIRKKDIDNTVFYKLPLVKENDSERKTIILDGEGTILCEKAEEG